MTESTNHEESRDYVIEGRDRKECTECEGSGVSSHPVQGPVSCTQCGASGEEPVREWISAEKTAADLFDEVNTDGK